MKKGANGSLCNKDIRNFLIKGIRNEYSSIKIIFCNKFVIYYADLSWSLEISSTTFRKIII